MDFEKESSSSITLEITATDDGNLSFTKEFKITVINVNESVTIAESDSSTDVGEDGTTDTYTLVLNSKPASDVIINIDPGNQLKTNINSLTFTDGNWNTPQTVTVSAIDDAIFEENHTGTITHTINSNSGYKDIKVDSVNVNITDNDTRPLTQTNSEINIFNILGQTGKPKLQVTLESVNSDGVNELGVFVVDDEQGRINGILPGEPGYTKAALERAKIIFSALTNSPNGFNAQSKVSSLEFPENAKLRFYLIDNSTTAGVLSGKTSTSQVVFSDTTTLKVAIQNQEQFTLAWNDVNAGNFADLVVKIQATDNSLPIGTNLQNSSQAELIDLTGLSQPTVTANFSVFREAAFNNEVYFYKVDAEGKIDGLAPNTTTYQQSALKNIVKDAVTGQFVKFSAANQGIETGTAQIETGSIIAPLIIVNGTLSQLTDNDIHNNPEVYFPYLGANTDGVDHIRLLAHNTFGFEDLPNGGDFDYNDLIAKIDFSV